MVGISYLRQESFVFLTRFCDDRYCVQDSWLTNVCAPSGRTAAVICFDVVCELRNYSLFNSAPEIIGHVGTPLVCGQRPSLSLHERQGLIKNRVVRWTPFRADGMCGIGYYQMPHFLL